MILLSDSKKHSLLENAIVVNSHTILPYVGNPDIEAIVCTRSFARLCQGLSFPHLKMVQLLSAGYDGLDLDYYRREDIHLCNAANVYNIGMAEFVVYAMLMRAKRYHRSIKNRMLRPFRNYCYITEMAGKTAGILGAGNIGSQIAKRLEAFDMHVLGFDIKTDDRPHFEMIYNSDGLTSFLGRCDYIINCMPLFKSTEGMICKEWFDNMKDDVTIINVGRKGIINDHDFLCFLKEHKDASAILDMFEKIPNPITNPYRRLRNVLVLPGVTAISREINEKLGVLIRENMRRLQDGEDLLNQIV